MMFYLGRKSIKNKIKTRGFWTEPTKIQMGNLHAVVQRRAIFTNLHCISRIFTNKTGSSVLILWEVFGN